MSRAMRIIHHEANKLYNELHKMQEEHNLWCDNLCGLCGIGSVMLHKRLKRRGILTDMVHVDGHCYLMFGQDTIIDVTYEQFDEDHCRPYVGYDGYDVHCRRKRFKSSSLAKWKTYQIRAGWMETQYAIAQSTRWQRAL